MINSYKLLILFLFTITHCNTSKCNKINGVSYVASKDSITDIHIKPLLKVNANSAAIMPFDFIKSIDQPEIMFNSRRQWFGETKAGVKQYILQLRKSGITIMLKPQIWVWHGEFTGYIEMQSENNWKVLEDSYSKFILEYAILAQNLNINIFCIGTELEKFIENRPKYWHNLILEIRKRYKGKLTYAANWDEFKRIPFWSDLDYIGIDAYFPVSEKRTPTINQLKKNWLPYKKEIEKYSKKYSRPILFTEYGYRSVDYTAREPWKSDVAMSQVNLEGQTHATQALFEVFWNEDWFAGGFIWKWFIKYNESGGLTDTQFTPQNKPVEDLLRKQYEHFK